eukprot:gnl/TRDRNA2_/TRDRNA2_143736_c0_seq4.p1 gnl/TRDRNA2_/TRDRNA2_143736_c0~~gnl/TRDRNA2_/TRDRNA2_143736_c0_seq4.p1  ORF type:complete len:545 (-),score=132.75 gnl/TRDRNA2_/TRDRNA2_143736_c0_seq4:134-1540(-)
MAGVEAFLENPGERDVPVRTIFTDDMFMDLKELMRQEKMQHLDEVEALWRGGSLHLGQRKVVSEFLKDGSLGAKRLISMPDRMTNTINVVTRAKSQYRPPPVCRPCAINNFDGDLSTTDIWWKQWKHFMFIKPLTVVNSGTDEQRPVEMLQPIRHSKYPEVTEDEERISIPLQIVCQAIFDCIIVHLMNLLSPNGTWQVVKKNLSDALYRRKQQRTLEILSSRYASHILVLPAKLDGQADQNSMILLKKDTFISASIKEVTPTIVELMEKSMKLADGDLIVIEVEGARDHKKYLIASFHGDTSGLLTMPVVNAVHEAANEAFKDYLVILGLDTNVYEQPKEGTNRKLFQSFVQEYNGMGFTSCFGDSPEVRWCRTTCSARTFLQPQLNKAIRAADKVEKSDMNPKDILLFYKNQLELVPQSDAKKGFRNPLKDNTGDMEYRENSIFPTMTFPSDHGIVAAVLRPASSS